MKVLTPMNTSYALTQISSQSVSEVVTCVLMWTSVIEDGYVAAAWRMRARRAMRRRVVGAIVVELGWKYGAVRGG